MNRKELLLLAIGIIGVLYVVSTAGAVISPELILLVSIMIVAVACVVLFIGGSAKVIQRL